MSQVGPYELIERIGMGGMAEVFKASQSGEEGFERLVAVKRILPNLSADPDFEKMFIDEAKIAVQLQHPNIAQIYDLGREGESLFIAMEYVQGRDMSTIIERQAELNDRTLPLSFVVQVVIKVCEALNYAHAAKGSFGQKLNLIHRDITPQNILVSYEGAVKVVDFGLAKAAGRLVQTQAGVVKGKLAYLSAEQARGENVDSRSDIYSLGTCFYEWLTGQRLFLRRTDADTVMAVQRSEVPPLRAIRPELPQALDRVVRRALQPDPRNRYQTAGEMQEELMTFAMEAGMPVRRRRLVEVLAGLYPDEVERPSQPQLAPAPPQPPPVPAAASKHTREIPGIGDEEETDESVPRDTIPAPSGAVSEGEFGDSTNVLLEADEAVMQVLTAPKVPSDANPFEDEVSAVPVVEHDSSTAERPSPPPGRAPLTDPGPEPIDGESTGDFSVRAEELAKSAEARAQLDFEDPTANYSEDDILKALADGPPESSGLPSDSLHFDEPTAMYTKDLAEKLLSVPPGKGTTDDLDFTDETVDSDPSGSIDEILEELEPLEGEATRTDGTSD
ncbi:MAG: serine/threonine protein kinase [Deltaproteobacteria bacterium]|nr:serine/threonine protein kinase [Deltaproteobacteria bacterium]